MDIIVPALIAVFIASSVVAVVCATMAVVNAFADDGPLGRRR